MLLSREFLKRKISNSYFCRGCILFMKGDLLWTKVLQRGIYRED